MSSPSARPAPPDQPQRQRALDASQSVLVQAPAGSGKTDLLTRRFLSLLAGVDEPGQIVAITFTIAAASEMRHRILSELEKAATGGSPADSADEFSMDTLAHRALARSRALGWELLDLPAQLRISTIDSFSRELALQQPLLTELGGELNISEQPKELYRRAARRVLETLDSGDSALREAIEALLLWRDNGWQEMENLLIQMLEKRDLWMRDFVLEREPDWEALRARLERPFARAVRNALNEVDLLFGQTSGAREEALALARFACEHSDRSLHQELAELAEFPSGPFETIEALEEACAAWRCVAALLLTSSAFRKRVDKSHGFPADCRPEKNRLLALIRTLQEVEGLEAALAELRALPPVCYSDDDWAIMKACFTLLRDAVGQLRIVFAEVGAADFIEVAQIAQRSLRGGDNQPTDSAIDAADGIRHLLVDEFQDTSRRQHQLLASLIAAWSERTGRTVFVVGDPMQSIYSFRDADAELFPRVQALGLEIPNEEALPFDSVQLTANFRTEPTLVNRLNESFIEVFALNDGSNIAYSSVQPARPAEVNTGPRLVLHLDFMPSTSQSKSAVSVAIQQRDEDARAREAARQAQTDEIVALISNLMPRVEHARVRGEKFRIAILGRARKALVPIAGALREASIPFRALELEQLRDRPEVLDALALARALLNPQDRVAWLGVLRAPWCGLALDDLHKLVSADDPETLSRTVPDLLSQRLHLLSNEGRLSVQRLLHALEAAPSLHSAMPTASLGTWLQQVWLNLGGAACVDATAHANIDLLWSRLDALPGGAQDLLGNALDAALEKLTALPDPEAGTDCGVQLMTIHKSKGLEFEVVIVPELQAGTGNNRSGLLSWLERGLAQPDDSDDITEFLVAPLQSKGSDRSMAKTWVDRVRRARESQETRRVLYVAATRARDELHLFARPAYKNDAGALSLVEPKNSLLATAWPALESEVRARFDQWKSTLAIPESSEEQTVESLAASGESNLLIMPSPAQPTQLRRLPADFQPTPVCGFQSDPTGQPLIGLGDAQLYQRHQGGLISRALGNAVHRLLEELARLRVNEDWESSRAALSRLQPSIAAQIRAAGVHQTQAASLAAEALDLAFKASRDPHGQWILSPRMDAASEASWAGIVSGSLRTVRVDRLFRAGLDPLSEGESAWWIIDYKTAHADNLDPAVVLPELRALFAPQLEAYAAVLRNLHGAQAQLRAALYYPRMSLFDWWQVEA